MALFLDTCNLKTFKNTLKRMVFAFLIRCEKSADPPTYFYSNVSALKFGSRYICLVARLVAKFEQSLCIIVAATSAFLICSKYYLLDFTKYFWQSIVIPVIFLCTLVHEKPKNTNEQIKIGQKFVWPIGKG